MLHPPSSSAFSTQPLAGKVYLGLGELFLAVSAALNVIGWVLALSGVLHATAYAIGLCAVLIAGALFGRRYRLSVPRVRRGRWKRIVPLAFAAALILSLLGGALHLPTNFDALSYRTPQLLHWLDARGWHWIDTPNSRMNIAPPGYNWLAAPLLIFTGTDRWTYLPNIVAFALFPGFLFEFLWRAGVRRRVGWWWMWLLPLGYVFATQSGGLGNDMIGAVYCAASLAMALRARMTGSVRDFGFSLLAVALCTGIKNVNLPVLLPWAVAIWPMWRCALRPAALLGFGAAAALSSCLPTTLLNLKHTGHWTGDPNDEHRVRQPNPISGAVSNSIELLATNTQPPIFPAANAVNGWMTRAIERSPFAEACRRSPRFEARWYEMPSEEHAGLGPGIVALGVINLIAAGRRRKIPRCGGMQRWDVALAGCVALLVPICLMSTDGLPRMLAPFCMAPLLVVLLPVVGEGLTRRPLWRGAAAFVALLPFPALLLSPARPLVPVESALSKRGKSPAIARAARVYRIYRERPDAFSPLKQFIPDDVHTVWLITFGDEPETSLWRPFGSRSMRHMLTLPERIERQSAVAISEAILRERFDMSVDDFASRYNLTVSGSTELDMRASGLPTKWSVLIPGRK